MAEAAAAGGGLGSASWWGAGLVSALAARYDAEGDRRLLWLPVFFGAGIAVYFSLTAEPPLWLGAVVAVAAGALAYASRRHRPAGEAALALVLVAAGFTLAGETTRECGTPMLERRLGPVAVTGRVVDVDILGNGWRLIVAPDPLPGLDPGSRMPRLRLHIPPSSDALLPGDRVAVKALLYPVPGPILPGGRDMQRDLYFAGIGAVGYSHGGARRIAAPEGSAAGGWRERLRSLRSEMTERITAVLPGSTGGVAAALITGKRGAVAEEVKEAFRNSGLSHLLAIAGLHLGLVAAFVFFTVRGGLALIPPVALRFPIKKIAAAAALLVLIGYLLISGAAIPTERAFVMNGLLFVAILLDRLRISMRVCAIAAAVVLAIEPVSLVGVSFQMSFGAVVALIAVYETFGARLARTLHRRSFFGRVLGYCGAVAITTLVATIGTLPFSVYHFHRLALYSPLANVVAVPVSALWTLPWGVAACLLMPFGLERFALVPMGWGIDLTIWVAETVSGLPGDVWAMPRLPTAGLVLVAMGGLWLCLWRGSWRRWGALAVIAGLAGMALTRPPDVVIADIGRFVALRAVDGHYIASSGHGGEIAGSFLAEDTGEALSPWPSPAVATAGLDCAGELCRYSARGRRVAIVTGSAALPLDCGAFDAIVAQVPAGFRCRATIPVIDRIDSWRLGAVALWLDPRGVAVDSANPGRGDRPWVPHPRRHQIWGRFPVTAD
jgi:competence protein ComEC